MKPFIIWLVGTLIGFAALAGGYHLALTDSPRQVLVVVDSSYPMTESWTKVSAALDRIDDRYYTLFSLMTEKSRVHGWQDRLALGNLVPYGPRNFDKLGQATRAPAFDQATEIIFLTNAPADHLTGFDGWAIIRP